MIDPPFNVPIHGHVSGKGRIRHQEFAMASGEMSREEFTAFLSRYLLSQPNISLQAPSFTYSWTGVTPSRFLRPLRRPSSNSRTYARWWRHPDDTRDNSGPCGARPWCDRWRARRGSASARLAAIALVDEEPRPTKPIPSLMSKP